MDLIEHFMNKNNKNINPSYSIKYLYNRKFPYFNNNINNINRESFKNFHINKSLPKIKSVSTSNIHKKYYNKNLFNSLDQMQKKSDKIIFNNIPNSSILKLNNNILSIKKSALLGIKIKPKYNFRNFQNFSNENYSSSEFVPKNSINYLNEDINKEKKEKPKKINSLIKNEHQKEFVKTVNIYFKNNFRNNEIVDENNNKKEENIIHKTTSMFMTGMNFLMPNHLKNKNKEKNENNDIGTNMENNENNDNLENKQKNINYNYLSFKDLLKHIEENKKKIIDNQNDIENMIITVKDTHNEIWKCNHWKK